MAWARAAGSVEDVAVRATLRVYRVGTGPHGNSALRCDGNGKPLCPTRCSRSERAEWIVDRVLCRLLAFAVVLLQTKAVGNAR